MKLLCVYQSTGSRQYSYDSYEEREEHIAKMLKEGWRVFHTSGNGKRGFNFMAIFDKDGE